MTFGYAAPHLATVKRWYNESNRRRRSLQNYFRGGRPKAVVLSETVDTMHKMTLQVRHVTHSGALLVPAYIRYYSAS